MRTSPKTLLVTGGCGYIGSHVVRQLSERGDEVVVIDDLTTGYADALLHGERLVVGSVGNEDLLNSVFGMHAIDAVLHFAASIRVEESVAQPLAYYENNAGNTVRLLRACAKARVPRFVFSSTAAVYGDQPRTPVKESDTLFPANPYGRSKVMSETALRDVAAATGMSYMILRYFNVAGGEPGGRLGQRTRNASHLIKVACEVVLGKRPHLSVFGTDYATPDGTCIRDYIHVEDLAGAHLAALDHLTDHGGSKTLNCGYGRGYSVREVIAAVERVTGKPLPVRFEGRRQGDIPKSVADCTALHATITWAPRFAELDAIIASSLAWESRFP